MPAKNRVTAIDRAPDQDGDHVIEVTCADGKVIDVAIDLAGAQLLVEILQKRLVAWAHESAKNLSLPTLDVIDMNIAHQGPDAQLMATTAQIGVLILQMSEETMRKTRIEVDRALTLRASPSAH